jgi:spermidine synthase
MNRNYVTTVVAVAGAAVLALEILGTRVLGPFYGVSLFLWSALITVTLAALSAGYFIGGIWADRKATLRRLGVLLIVSGIWIMAIPLIRHPFMGLAQPLGLRVAVLVAAMVLFFPPLMLLGMIAPLAIKLRTASLAEVGRTAGSLYAISTIASVASALLTGFFLIPNIGVNKLLFLTGAALVATGVAGFALQKRSAVGTIAVVVLAIAGVGSWSLLAERADPESGLVAIVQSPYGEIRVLDSEDGRHMLIDGGVHTLVDTETWVSRLPYTAVMEIPKYYFEHAGTVLLIGLGGGSLVRQYGADRWAIDVVEIDQSVTDVAFQYFRLKPSWANFHHSDGRQYLLAHQDRYDLILVDAFGSSSIPFHLVTSEAFGLMRERLSPEGILAINVESIGWHSRLVYSLCATLRTQFASVLVLPIAEPRDQLGNLIILASDRSLEAIGREPARTYDVPNFRFSSNYQRVHAWDNRFTPATGDAPILTDDLNPVDVWSETVNLAARQALRDYFPPDTKSW